LRIIGFFRPITFDQNTNWYANIRPPESKTTSILPDASHLRIPTKKIAYSDLMSIKIGAQRS